MHSSYVTLGLPLGLPPGLSPSGLASKNCIISENKPYNLRLCTFTLHKFQEKNLCK